MHLKYLSKRKKKLAKVSNVSRQCPRHWRILPATISKRPRLSAKRLVKTCVLKNVPEIAGTTYMPTKQYAQLLNIRCLLPNWIFIIIAIIIYRHSYTLRVNTWRSPWANLALPCPFCRTWLAFLEKTKSCHHHSSVTLVYLGYTFFTMRFRKNRENFKDTFASLLHYLHLLDLDHLLDMIKL